ncbi:MAG: hypothetical protein IPH14_05210 [Thermomonas sp.]|uniref:hypothetical protein n=1 Tax=Thermomonas sp. TaxID=1971895 RepID=UPI0025D20B30|nr:hypothetical protein [Thermomonas sp.]MBK6924667.1 hypothetical protein [Thermomonas sp.]
MPLDDFANADGEALVDLRGRTGSRALLERWLPPVIDAVPKREVALDFADGAQFVLRASRRWPVLAQPARHRWPRG